MAAGSRAQSAIRNPQSAIAAIVRRPTLVAYGAALALVAATTLIIGGILQVVDVANSSTLYLIPILIISSRFGRGPAIVAALVAIVAFNWFFVEPIHTFNIARSEELVALLLLLLTATVTGQLAAEARARNRELQRREREAQLLRAIVATVNDPNLPADEARAALEARLRAEVGLQRARIELGATAGQYAPPPDPRDGRGLALAIDGEHGARLGRLVAARAPEAPPLDAADAALLRAAAAQLGSAYERARFRQDATEVETLRRTDELKTALLNAVSHDLRTPLASILASAQSLRGGDVAWSEEEGREFLGAIEQESLRLNTIVGNLLDLSRIQGGTLHPERAWHDLGALIGDVVARLRERHPRHAFAVEVPPDLPPVFLDPVAIDQVLTNLLDNAAKYSPPETKIWLSVQRGEREVRVVVADRGRGLAEGALRHLFTPFYRVLHRPSQPGPPGTGLGLAVARGLIEAHGGRIWAEQRDGGGAAFTFTLPLQAPAGSAAAELAEDEER